MTRLLHTLLTHRHFDIMATAALGLVALALLVLSVEHNWPRLVARLLEF